MAITRKYTWTNAAYAMAVNINRSFKEYGWCTASAASKSGGAVEGTCRPHLPVPTMAAWT